jgi:hypothetical protein
MVANEAHVMLRGFHLTGDVAKIINDDLLFSLCNHAIIIVCKFLEVWNDFGSLARENSRALQLRRAVLPVIDRITIWDGLTQYRNTALAHPYLTRDKQLVGPWQLLNEHRAPTYHAECILLLFCVHLAVLATLCAFPEEYQGLKPILGSNLPDPAAGPGIISGRDIQAELRRLAQLVDPKLNEMGAAVAGPIAAEFRRASTTG